MCKDRLVQRAEPGISSQMFETTPPPPRAASVLIKPCGTRNKPVGSTRAKSLRLEQEFVLNRSRRVCFLLLGCALSPWFWGGAGKCRFRVALSLVEDGACRAKRIALPGKGLGEDSLLCFSAGTHLPRLPLETAALSRMRTSSSYQYYLHGPAPPRAGLDSG